MYEYWSVNKAQYNCFNTGTFRLLYSRIDDDSSDKGIESKDHADEARKTCMVTRNVASRNTESEKAVASVQKRVAFNCKDGKENKSGESCSSLKDRLRSK
jgi:hypothetical protein